MLRYATTTKNSQTCTQSMAECTTKYYTYHFLQTPTIMHTDSHTPYSTVFHCSWCFCCPFIFLLFSFFGYYSITLIISLAIHTHKETFLSHPHPMHTHNHTHCKPIITGHCCPSQSLSIFHQHLKSHLSSLFSFPTLLSFVQCPCSDVSFWTLQLLFHVTFNYTLFTRTTSTHAHKQSHLMYTQ